ncbi:MAG: TonB-dependent receptor [Polyangiaceae bacterium]|nr:TonB-dependent receptor [Polyangiaceae bacterium]
MSSFRPRLLGACAAGLLVSLAASSAWADARSDAKRHYKQGMAYIDVGRFDEGIRELETAYQILPHPNVLYNIARAYAQAGRIEDAIAGYEEFLKTEPEDRTEAQTALDVLRAELERRKAAAAKPPPPGPKPEPGTPPVPGTPEPVAPKPGVPEPAKPIPVAPTKPGADADLYEESVVTASRRAQSPLDSPNSTAIITRQDIDLSGIVRIPELLRRVAGIDVMQITAGDSNVSMRGNNSRLSNKLLVLVNGRAIKNDILGSTFWEAQSFDVDQIDHIEVVRGPGSSLYGADAVAGVVNIILKEPGEGSTGMRAGFGDHAQTYGSMWAAGKSGDFAFRGGIGYTRSPRWTREIEPGRVDLNQADANPDLGAENVHADLRAAYRIDGDKRIEFGGGFTRSFINIYGIGPFNDLVIDLNGGDASLAYKSDLLDIRTNYTLLDAEARLTGAYRGHVLYDTDALQHSFETDIELKPEFDFSEDVHNRLITGVSYRLKNIAWSYLVEEPPVEHHGALFLQDTIEFGDRFTTVVSGRVDYVPTIKRVVPSARLALIGKPTESKRQAIRASVATAFRSPTFLEAYLELPIQLQIAGVQLESNSVRLDDPDFRLGPENIVETEINYLNQESDAFQFEIATYFQRITDLIRLADPRLMTLSNKGSGVGGFDPESGRITEANGGWENSCIVDNNFGGEIGGRWYGVEGLDVFANYAINYSKFDQPEGCNVVGDERTSHHKINVGTQVRAPVGFEGEITFHWQSAQTWGEQVATLTGIETQLFDLPAYSILNARLGWGFLERKLVVAGVVYNALAGAFGPPEQQHPFGNRIGRRFMGFLSYEL